MKKITTPNDDEMERSWPNQCSWEPMGSWPRIAQAIALPVDSPDGSSRSLQILVERLAADAKGARQRGLLFAHSNPSP